MLRAFTLSIFTLMLAACSESRLEKGTIIPKVDHDEAQCPNPADIPVNNKISIEKTPHGPLSVITAENPEMEFIIDGRQKSRSPDGKKAYIFRGGCSNKGLLIRYMVDRKYGTITVEKKESGYVYSNQFDNGKVETTELHK